MHEINHKALQMEKVLGALSPTALRMLERSVEDTLQSGKPVPNAELMVHTIRRLLGEASFIPDQKLSLEMPLKRAILSPLQPFLNPVPLKVQQQGRIDPAVIDTLWAYMREELLSDEFNEALAALEQRCEQQDLPANHETIQKALSTVADGLRMRLVAAAKKALAAADHDIHIKTKLRRKVGGHVNFDFLCDALVILDRALAWEEVMSGTKPFEEDILSMSNGESLERLRKHVEHHAGEVNYLAALSYVRLGEAPTELIRLAQALAAAPKLKEVANTPYAAFVEYALSALEQSVQVVEGWKREEGAVIGLPEAVNASLIHFVELDELEELASCEQWHQRAMQLKNRLCNLLRDEMRNLPKLLEEAIASQTKPDTAVLQSSDQLKQVQRAYHKCLRGLKLARLASQYAGVLGLNELQNTTRIHVERFIDRNSEKLLTPAQLGQAEAKNPLNYGEISRKLSCLISMSEISLEPEDTANLIRRHNMYFRNAA
ncbi:hypothetical protein PsAD2_00983 [Pseudovibrio axinellae]|uniref:Uncharacterized protein n=1 Tax=Pseudovibrio axinellae TaxID=989403 RepID=A0A166AF82_9HYPH|nr:hypothetical protein [Pseudovibrio axinellae]KZL20991.1 hypothetical protein PsAD2_00983 [Pseudovibrio axinellae]SEP79864.1 hypothetical protein SAMN05421798_101418 [Pseudovibrio axinellae]